MISFLFWNIRKKPLQAKIANLASLHEIDLIMLTESSIPPAVMLSTLNQDRGYDYHYAANIGCKKVDIFTKFPSNFLFPIFETERLTIRKLALPGQTDILLAVTHFPSKLYWDESSQCSESIELSTMIKEAEKNIGHSRTVLVGDFNMNPFEDGVINANGLHAVMTRGIAKKGKRIVQAKEYPMFYNPMWAFFGERQSEPPGTYYYESSVHKVFFWNIFDQVLFRPDLLAHFDTTDLKILHSDGKESFLSTSGIPNKDSFSDHLPILFRLNL